MPAEVRRRDRGVRAAAATQARTMLEVDTAGLGTCLVPPESKGERREEDEDVKGVLCKGGARWYG